ncbi:MAG: hypothetical protein L0L09_14040 [Staphylococcus equorum]|nr:hypothetical protein [Staphylococcus equorum]
MTLLPLNTLNTEVRELFNDWFQDAMQPNLRIVASRIGIGYATLKNFKTGTDSTYNNLTKVLNFLEKQGFKLKEKA